MNRLRPTCGTRPQQRRSACSRAGRSPEQPRTPAKGRTSHSAKRLAGCRLDHSDTALAVDPLEKLEEVLIGRRLHFENVASSRSPSSWFCWAVPPCRSFQFKTYFAMSDPPELPLALGSGRTEPTRFCRTPLRSPDARKDSRTPRTARRSMASVAYRRVATISLTMRLWGTRRSGRRRTADDERRECRGRLEKEMSRDLHAEEAQAAWAGPPSWSPAGRPDRHRDRDRSLHPSPGKLAVNLGPRWVVPASRVRCPGAHRGEPQSHHPRLQTDQDCSSHPDRADQPRQLRVFGGTDPRALVQVDVGPGRQLIVSSVPIWLTNVIVFGLWYWSSTGVGLPGG